MVQKQPDIDCIYDFIYLDTTRLTSYLAQLDDGMMDVANAIRQFLGRPSQAYGIMPIAIFKTVGR